LEDGNSLFDYDVGMNDIIQLMVRPLPTPSTSPQSPKPTTNGTTHASPQADPQNGNGGSREEQIGVRENNKKRHPFHHLL
jgi:hypothetical protein